MHESQFSLKEKKRSRTPERVVHEPSMCRLSTCMYVHHHDNNNDNRHHQLKKKVQGSAPNNPSDTPCFSFPPTQGPTVLSPPTICSQLFRNMPVFDSQVCACVCNDGPTLFHTHPHAPSCIGIFRWFITPDPTAQFERRSSNQDAAFL